MVNPYQPPGNTPRYASFPKRFTRACGLAGREFRLGMKREGLSWFRVVVNIVVLTHLLLAFGGVLLFMAFNIFKTLLSGPQ